MSTERLLIVDPYDNNQLEQIKEFEHTNFIDSKISNYLEKINKSVSKEEYQNQKKQKNEIEEVLVITKNSKIIDCCSINGEKDIKTCRITPLPIKDTKKRNIIELATDFSINNLGIKEVFISVSESDQVTIKELEKNGFENLGNYNGKTVYLKEKEEKENIQRKVA